MNCTCPNCKNKNIHLGKVNSKSSGAEVNTLPHISITPAKFKFTLIDNHCMVVEKIWAICEKCGLVWTDYDPELLSMKIEKWLKEKPILGTKKTNCLGCKNDCLSWELHAAGDTPYEIWIEFKKAKFKLTLNTSPYFDIEQRVTLCPNCHIMYSKSNSSEVKEKISLFSPEACN